MTIYLVRHAHAGSRSHWESDDEHRPLSPKGRDQADALAARYADRPVGIVLSSPAVRCQQTVAPLAHDHGLLVEVREELAEGTPARHGVQLLRSLASTAGDAGDAVLCSHGDVIPDVLRALMADGVDLVGDTAVHKGGTFEIDTAGGTLRRAVYVPPAR